MKKVADLIKNSNRGFSIEILPPLKGNGTSKLYTNLDEIISYNPLFINVTSHCKEKVFHECDDNKYLKVEVRKRPGTVAVSAAIQNRYNIPVVPHIVCAGQSKQDIEYQLIDCQFLGLNNLFLLRGDRDKENNRYIPVEGGLEHTTQLETQISQFNKGYFCDDSVNKSLGEFSYGVACYPEKHEESMNLREDLKFFKIKEELGAEYAITQMCFSSETLIKFKKICEENDINIPIIPGVKPLTKLSQLKVIPRVFHCEFPEDLSDILNNCKSDEDVKKVGINWAVDQCSKLFDNGFGSVHFYTVGAIDSVIEIIKRLHL